MDIWQRRGLRTLFSVAFLFALMLGSGMSMRAANAATSVTLTDGFEGHPAFRWWFQEDASQASGSFLINEGLGAYTPANNAQIYAVNGWSAVGRTINLPLTTPYSKWFCTASIMVKIMPYYSPVPLNFEIIDPTNWTYIKLHSTTRYASSAYQQISMSFIPTRKDMVVRIAVIDNIYNKQAWVDDLYVNCKDY